MKSKYSNSANCVFNSDANFSLKPAGSVAVHWLSDKPVYLTTKTTGVDQFAQIIEIAILDTDQSVLFHTQLMPNVAIDKDAERLHGLNLSALQGRPYWFEVVAKIQSIVKNRKVIIFNALFEMRLLQQTCQAYNLPVNWIDNLTVSCSMHLAANAYGVDNRYGTVSFEHALSKAAIDGYHQNSGTVTAAYAMVQMIRSVIRCAEQDNAESKRSTLQIAV
ncbi:MAG: 3'-5' exonuclease [Oceanospirillaceae bacterium]